VRAPTRARALAETAGAAVALVLAAATCGMAAPAQTALRIERVARNLDQPTYATSAPGDRRTLYVVEQPGRILALAGGDRRTFLDIRTRVRSGGEQGLLSVAFDPAYATNHRFYVDYTDTDGNTRVVEYRSRRGVGVPSSARQLLFVAQPYANHNGGQLQFGPDGLLYVGMGDGGSAGDPGNRAQNLATRLGKLLRTDPSTAPSRWSIAGYGLRNPWRFSFDRRTGALWIGDVGQGAREEIDRRTRAQLTRRWNYGWPVFEGTQRFKNASLNRNAPLVEPVHEYGHEAGRCSVTGGYVYRGSAVPAARGRYFFGDFCTGEVWSLRGAEARKEPFRVPSLSSFGEDGNGELYLTSLEGSVYRLTS
jgi:glucose/arabinose dehydrogenase